ncbi:hypothetical protein ACCD00_21805 [Pseudomonas sp. Pseusp3]
MPPLKNWSHPFGDRGNPLQQLTQLANAQAGYYPFLIWKRPDSYSGVVAG